MSGAGHVYYPFSATSYGDSHGYTHQHGTSITPYRERYINQDHRGSAHLTQSYKQPQPYQQTQIQPQQTYSKFDRITTPEKQSYSPNRPATSYAAIRNAPTESFEYTPAPIQLSLHQYPEGPRPIYHHEPTYTSRLEFRRSAPLKTLSDDALAQTVQRPQAQTARSFSSSLGRSSGTSTFINRPGLSREAYEATQNYCKRSLSRRVPEHEMKQGALPGYMGFVRVSQFKHGNTFGKTSRQCMDEMPLPRPASH